MEIVALVISFAALLISAATLWRTALKPGEIVADELVGSPEVAGGGMRDVPSCFGFTVKLAISNAGARTVLLELVELSATAAGEPRFVTGEVAEPRWDSLSSSNLGSANSTFRAPSSLVTFGRLR